MSMYDIGVVRRKRVTQQSSMMFGQSIAAGGFDAATTQWINAVYAVDHTVVSTPQATLVDNLIVGLKADGLFTKLDRLWLFAIENQTEALVDIVADSLATAVNSPTFTIDAGFAAASNSNIYIDTNFNPSTAPSPNFVRNSACLLGWNNTFGQNTGPLIGLNSISGEDRIYPEYTDTNTYWGVNGSGETTGSLTGATGLYVVNRTGAGAETLDINGSQVGSGTTASVSPSNANLIALAEDPGNSGLRGTRQVSAVGFGGSLSGTDRTNIYSRLLTYMAAVFTQRWVNTVITNGGTVSAGRQTLVNALINGLMTDGAWYKLDRLWLFAGENQGSALTDIVADQLATTVNSPTFTPDLGITGDLTATPKYTSSNYNFSTNGVNYTQDLAHLSLWNLTSGTDPFDSLNKASAAPGINIFPKFTDNNCYTRINDNPEAAGLAISDPRGHIIGNRSGPTARQTYQNGASLGTIGSTASTALPNDTLNIDSRQIAMVSIGGSLSPTDAANFYSRLRTYMSAIGVP